jgi:hypothetical protein
VIGEHHDPFAKPGLLVPAGAEPIVRAVDLQKFYGGGLPARDDLPDRQVRIR